MRFAFCVFLVPSLAQAQARCTDSLAGARWRATPLSATVTEPAAGEKDRDRYVRELLGKFAVAYRDPADPLKRPGAMSVVAIPEQRQAVHGAMEVAVDRNGRVIEARITTSSGDRRLDSAWVTAALGADQGRGFGRLPRKLRGDTVRFALTVADRGLPEGATHVGTVSRSFLDADVAPRIRTMPTARAPRGHRGEVVLAGTVGSNGRLMPGSIRVVSATDSALIPPARRSFEGTIYRPGTYHGCPAEATIRQVFPFR